MLPPESRSLWLAHQSSRFEPLQGDREADVVVVGAGIAGLTAAVLLARAGLEVVVLEARTIGAGTTGHTTAKISALQGARYRQLASVHGPDVARRYAAAQLDALAWMADEVETAGIDCAWETRPAVTYATDGPSRQHVQEEVAAARASGLEVTFVEDCDVPFPTTGAVVLDDQAQFDPYPYLGHLAEQVANSPTGTVHEHTRVTAVRGLRSPEVATDHGTVRADGIVLATLLPIVDRGFFFARSEPRASYSLALSVDEPLPTGMYLSASSPTRSLRTARRPDGDVLVIGGGGHIVGRQTPTMPEHEHLLEWAEKQFRVRDVLARWSAHDYVPVDHLPWAGPAWPPSPHIQVATGFGKWGMTNGTAAALAIVDRVLDRADGPSAAWADVFDPSRVTAHGVASSMRANAGVALQMVRGWTKPGSPGVGPKGEGRTRRSGIGPVGEATSKDSDPQVRLVCTHLGGVCRWNDAERTWDCPLHGSRYEADGTVLTAPASRPLRRRPPEAPPRGT